MHRKGQDGFGDYHDAFSPVPAVSGFRTILSLATQQNMFTDHDVNDSLVTASAATVVNSLELSSAEIADKEIKIWKSHTVPFPKNKNPLDECRRGAVHLYSWLGVLARRLLAIPTTSGAPERLFSMTGNVMTKKRSRLTCDKMEGLVYLHEVYPQVREWEAVKKMRSE